MSFPNRRAISPGLDVPQNDFVLNAGDDMAENLIAWYPITPSWEGKRLVDRSLYGNPDITPLGTDVIPTRSGTSAHFRGPETSTTETGNGLRMTHTATATDPLGKIPLAGNDFTICFSCQVINMDGEGLWASQGFGNSSRFFRLAGTTNENFLEFKWRTASQQLTVRVVTAQQKTLNDLFFVTVAVSRSTTTADIFLQGGRWSGTATIFDEDHASTATRIIYGGDIARWAHCIYADIAWYDVALSAEQAARHFDPLTRWNLRYQLGQRTYSFPSAAVIAAAGSDIIRLRRRRRSC